MAKKTIQQRLITMLLAQGHVEVAGKSSKCRVFSIPAGPDAPGWLFIGKMGNVRINRIKPTITDSLCKTGVYRVKLRIWEAANQSE